MAIYAKENADSRAAQSTQRGNRDAVQAKEGNLLSSRIIFSSVNFYLNLLSLKHQSSHLEYMVVSKKGEGTFSEVLECRNRSNDESVAVKKLKQRYDRSGLMIVAFSFFFGVTGNTVAYSPVFPFQCAFSGFFLN